MTRRLVLLAAVAVLALLVYVLLAVLERAASAQNTEQPERPASQQVSRSLSRPVLSLPLSESPADHLRVGGDQTSPGVARTSGSQSRSVASVGSGVRGGEAATPEPIALDVWDRLAWCESRGQWSINTGNGYYGGLQMDADFWRSYGDPAYARADLAPKNAQIAAAVKARDSGRGYSPWPACSKRLGLR